MQNLQKLSIPFITGTIIAGSVAFMIRTITTEPLQPTTASDVEASCFTEIAEVTTAEEAFLLGESYFGGDRPYSLACAKIAYGKAATLDVDNELHLLLYQQGRINFLEGQFESALNKFDKQIELFADRVPPVYYMIGLTNGFLARKTGDEAAWEAAEEGFLFYIPYEPEAPWPRVDLAWVYFSQGKFEKMLPILEQGLEYEPENPWLLNMYGLALMNTDQLEEAKIAFANAKVYYTQLTPEDWGRTYPGNNPLSWDQGLGEFGDALDKNIKLVEDRLK